MAVPRTEFLDPDVLSTALPQLTGSSTLPSMLHELLEAAIISGRLKPGERLHADDLASHYGVSRIPVREAMRSLHEAGWVEIRPRHGVRIREHTRDELDELFEFRAVVESQVAKWAAARRTAEQLASLREVVDKLQRKRVGSAQLLTSIAAFYDIIREAANNTVLANTSETLEKRARFYFATVADEMQDNWLATHTQLLDHIEHRKAGAAGRLASEHIVSTGAAVRALLFP